MDNVFSVDELLTMNTMLLGRGAPNQDDGIGYNKADYSVCSNYYEGLSHAQLADLAKRLVKYSNTQLNIDKKIMMETAEFYDMRVTGEFNRLDGISINVTEDGTLIAFKYDESFVEVIKSLPRRRYDGDTKQWVVPNKDVIKTLETLREVGADVDNAVKYAMCHELIKDSNDKVEIIIAFTDDNVCMKFDYDEDIVNEIRKIDRSARKWNQEHKHWLIDKNYFKPLMQALKDVASFREVRHG